MYRIIWIYNDGRQEEVRVEYTNIKKDKVA